MTFYDSILINLIYIISPLILYYFFACYNSNLDKEENNLILELSLFTSLYFTIKLNSDYNILVINIPLIISYSRKKRSSIILLSLFCVFYLYRNFDLNLYLLIIEYSSYYLMNKLVKKNIFFNILFILINILIYISNFIFISNVEEMFFTTFLFLIVITIVIFILNKADKVMKYHMSIKELEHEKQFRSTLFKITHEIKNPLAVCKGYLDMFDVNNAEHSQKYIPIIKNEVDKTLILLKDFLNFTKIKVELEILDVNYLIEQTLDNMKLLLSNKDITIVSKVADDEFYIMGDYNRLSQVITNIIKNSVEALEKIDDPKIVVSSKLNGQFVEIIISDNGEGMDNDSLTNISTPFFTTKKEGTGLGVSLSFEIIKAHNGTIRYTSSKNKGTKAIINLPIKKEL